MRRILSSRGESEAFSALTRAECGGSARGGSVRGRGRREGGRKVESRGGGQPDRRNFARKHRLKLSCPPQGRCAECAGGGMPARALGVCFSFLFPSPRKGLFGPRQCGAGGGRRAPPCGGGAPVVLRRDAGALRGTVRCGDGLPRPSSAFRPHSPLPPAPRVPPALAIPLCSLPCTGLPLPPGGVPTPRRLTLSPSVPIGELPSLPA